MEVEVDEIGPSPRYVTAKVNKANRSGGGGGGFGGGGGSRSSAVRRSGRRPVGQRPGIGFVRRRRRRAALLIHVIFAGQPARPRKRKTWPRLLMASAPKVPVKTRKCVFCSKKAQTIDYADTGLLRPTS